MKVWTYFFATLINVTCKFKFSNIMKYCLVIDKNVEHFHNFSSENYYTSFLSIYIDFVFKSMLQNMYFNKPL